MYVCTYVRVHARILTHQRTILPSGGASCLFNSQCDGVALAVLQYSTHKFARVNCCERTAFARGNQSLTNQNVHNSANAATPLPVPGRDW